MEGLAVTNPAHTLRPRTTYYVRRHDAAPSRWQMVAYGSYEQAALLGRGLMTDFQVIDDTDIPLRVLPTYALSEGTQFARVDIQNASQLAAITTQMNGRPLTNNIGTLTTDGHFDFTMTVTAADVAAS